MPKKKRKRAQPYVFFPVSILSNIILPYLFPQIGLKPQDYLSKCIKIILRIFHFPHVYTQVLTDFIHVYCNHQCVDVFQTSQFLSRVMLIQTFQELKEIISYHRKDFNYSGWILPLMELLVNVNVNKIDALHWASENGYTSTVELLLDRKADISALQHYALRWASYNGHTSTVELLLDRKADIGAQEHFALRWASYKGQTSTVELLLNRKADVSARENYAIQWASKHGYTSVVELLIDRKADVNVNENFAILWAFENGHTSTVQLLLERKADATGLPV